MTTFNTVPTIRADHSLNCLLVSPPYSRCYVDQRESCDLLGAKAIAPPLGLITAAAILPQQWRFRLLDLHTRDFSEADWDWADLVCVGGMYTQKAGLLEVIARARRDHKFVVAGGVDPTSQPDLYKDADALVLDEGEASIPLWLESCGRGHPAGVFRADQRPDVTTSPIPRFDLLHVRDYARLSIQYSRGCPFTCEFCDIIELFGRIPRTKGPAQLLAELDALYRMGYRGQIDLVDDNFIGNKRNVKALLTALIAWNKAHRQPFFYSTEASLNLADDAELLGLMRAAGFRYIFTGIESPDPELLWAMKKRQNTTAPIVDRVNRIYSHGIAVYAGFIIGFDHEKPGTDQAIIRCVEETGICNASVSLLVALPNTQLARRLAQEGRLLTEGDLPRSQVETYDVLDQLPTSLNFIPTREPSEILREYVNVLKTIFEPRRYMDRVLRTARKLRGASSSYRPGWGEWLRSLWAAIALSIALTRDRTTRRLYWRNVLLCLPLGFGPLEYAMRHMATYLHCHRHAELVARAFATWKIRPTRPEPAATEVRV